MLAAPRAAYKRPYGNKDAVILFKTPNREGLHIEDVKSVDGEWLVTGTSAWGADLLRHRADHEAGAAPSLPGQERHDSMYYREDIGDRWFEEDSDRLHAWGYLRD